MSPAKLPPKPTLARWTWLPWVVLPALVALAYHGVWRAGFIWDDDYHLTRNACIVGSRGLLDIWTSAHARICPLVLSNFWLQHKLWDLNPLPYHLVNVAMHAAGALTLWRALRALDVRGAWLGAALWALHPVQVESVAWITELKNTQSGLFFALAVLCMARWAKADAGSRRRWWNYGGMILCSALAMASKSSAVVLPVILALCVWWLERRFRWRTLLALSPVLALALAASALSLWTQHLEGANEPEWQRTMAERLATAGRVPWFYLGKLLWPTPLIFVYPRWQMDTTRILTWMPLLLLTVALAVLWWGRDGRRRALFMTAACFLAALFPVLGIFTHFFLRYSFVGDHFQYLASMAPLALVGAGVATLPRLLPARNAWPALAAGGVLLLACSVMTWRRTPIYETSLALWSDTAQQNPGAWVAWNNLGVELLANADDEAALAAFRKSAGIFPAFSKSHMNIGTVMLRKGQQEEAIVELREAIRLEPDLEEAHNHLSVALLESGNWDEAIASCRRVIELRSASPDAHTNMGNALAALGRTEDAIKAWQDALKADAGYAEAHINLCAVFSPMKRTAEAITHGERAVALLPNDAAAHSALGSALREAGRLEEAVVEFQKSLRANADNGATHNNLANALRALGRITEAIPSYEKAAELMPDNIAVLNNLAWALATCPDDGLRNGARAVELSQRTMQLLGGENPSLMRTLAAGYASDGNFAMAQEVAERALVMLGTQGDAALAAGLRDDLIPYRSGRPVIDQTAPLRKDG